MRPRTAANVLEIYANQMKGRYKVLGIQGNEIEFDTLTPEESENLPEPGPYKLIMHGMKDTGGNYMLQLQGPSGDILREGESGRPMQWLSDAFV